MPTKEEQLRQLRKIKEEIGQRLDAMKLAGAIYLDSGKLKKGAAVVTAAATVGLPVTSFANEKAELSNTPTTIETTMDDTIATTSNTESVATTTDDELANAVYLFPDVPLNHWAFEAVYSLVADEAITGYADGTFKPSNSITRAEFSTMIAKALKMVTTSEESTFTDMNKAKWAEPNVVALTKEGLISGVGDNKFNPTANITRQDAAVIIAKALTKYALDKPLDDRTIDDFTDKDQISDYAKAAVNTALAYGVINGYENKTFGPLKTITRAEAAQMIAGLTVQLKINHALPEIKRKVYGEWEDQEPTTIEDKNCDGITKKLSDVISWGPTQYLPLDGTEQWSSWMESRTTGPIQFKDELKNSDIIYNTNHQIIILKEDKIDEDGYNVSRIKIHIYQPVAYVYATREVVEKIIYNPNESEINSSLSTLNSVYSSTIKNTDGDIVELQLSIDK